MRRQILPMIILGSLLLSALSCNMGEPADPSFKTEVNPNFAEEVENPAYFHRSMKGLTDVIIHDIFSPPQAARIYAYPSIAAYEILRFDHKEYASLAGQLRDLEQIPQPEAGKEISFPLASLHAFLETGKFLIFSEDKIEALEKEIYQEIKDLGISKGMYDNSIAYGKKVSDHILTWVKNDMYNETRTYPKYTIPQDASKWKPTPPDYMDGIEPHWKSIRTLVIDSSSQFTPPPPTPFSTDKNSQFYKETMEVYEVVKNLKEEEMAIAEFWDCNPYVSHHTGHVMYATKKITPGGHWMGITDIVTRKVNADMMKTIEAYTRVSISLFDAFISCWDEKYRSSLIRPETVINSYIDEDWQPALQTPPFPEHTSGHSVISSASAVALTDLFGDNFSYIDSAEVEYGLPPRSFNSFYEASEEAAVSRLYGGIHYRPAIDLGVDQGKKVGKMIVERIKTSPDRIGLKEE